MSVTTATLSGVACCLAGAAGAAPDDGETEDRDERDRGTGHPFPY